MGKNNVATAKTKNSISPHTMEVLAREMIDEGLEPWAKKAERLRRFKPGSAAYRDTLVDLWTLCDIIEIKAKVSGEMIDEYLDILPDDD